LVLDLSLSLSLSLLLALSLNVYESEIKMVTSDSGGGGKLTKVLGLGYWVQGFRCFPWLVVSFYLKDGLNVDPSTLQILQNSANLPMVGKPLYGLVSDSVYIYGQHRVPYIAFGGKVVFTLFISPYPSAFSLLFVRLKAKLHTFTAVNRDSCWKLGIEN